ncbi:helix-turn-helix domain-containing protein [Emticicia fontis]
MHIGKIIKQKLDEKRYSQKDLAEYLKITPQAVQSLLNTENPRMDTVIKVSEFFGISLNELIGSESNQVNEQTHQYDLLLENQKLQQKIIELQEKLINTQAADLERLKNDKKSVADI